MALCSTCNQRSECKKTCKDLNKQITGRGKTARRKPKTYNVDFSFLENSQNNLNEFQRTVLSSNRYRSKDFRDALFLKIDIEEALTNSLLEREQFIIRSYYLFEFTQTEIAERLGICQPRVYVLQKRAIEKLRTYMLR